MSKSVAKDPESLTILITGGAGFIGSAVVRYLMQTTHHRVVNVDKLTYAASLTAVASVSDDPRYRFFQTDICDAGAMTRIFALVKPDVVMHLAAETHVDRSIDGPADFIQTNLIGTYTLLEVARSYWNELSQDCQRAFRFHHISTDEVYGSLGKTGLFSETSPYQPNSPYAATKAGSDHLVRAWHKTYGLPVITTNCSNNYGPWQFPEKLIPLMILNALEGKPLPIYGDGQQVRDWLYVEDHARGLWQAVSEGNPGETYNIGGHNERTNLQVVETLCGLLDELVPQTGTQAGSYRALITRVTDRPGHDRRYAIDASKIQRTLGWKPDETFTTGLRKTVQWYLDNRAWCESVQKGNYQRQRLGTGTGHSNP